MRDFLGDNPLFAVVFLGGSILVAVMTIIVSTGNRLTFPGQLASIEQLRKDAARVSAASSEDVIGQVTAINQTIASNRRYNSMWWSDILIPDGWDAIEPIEVP